MGLMMMILIMMMMMKKKDAEDAEDDGESRQGSLRFAFFPVSAPQRSLNLSQCPPPLSSASVPLHTCLRWFSLGLRRQLFTLHTCPCWFCSGPCRPGMKEPWLRSKVWRSAHPHHATDVWTQSLGTWSLLVCFLSLSAQTFPGRLQRSIGVNLLPSGSRKHGPALGADAGTPR